MLSRQTFTISIFFLIIFILSTTLNFAQDDEGFSLEEELLLLEEEEEVVESASKYKQRIIEAPSAITVITEEDIKFSGATSVAELLRMVPGMVVKYLNPGDPITGIREMTPKTANHLLVLVDGREVSWEFTGIPLWEVLGITPADIKRIEVIRGPGSALYGANAYSGVVNITTKRPEDIDGIDIYLLGCEYKNMQSWGMAGGRKGDIGYSVSASTRNLGDWFDEDAKSSGFQSGRGFIEWRSNENTSLSGEIGGSNINGLLTSAIDFDITGLTNYARLNYNIGGLRTQVYWNRFDMTLSNRFIFFGDILAAVEPLFGSFIEDMTDMSISDLEDALNIGFIGFSLGIISNTYDASFDYTLNSGDWNRLIFGGNLRYSSFTSPYFEQEEVSEKRAGIFIQDELSITKFASLTTGARYDWSNKIEGEVSPRASLLLYPIKDHSLRLSYGKAFRKPSFLESQLEVKGLGEFMAPEKDLDNEVITSYEVGIMGRYLDNKLKIGIDFFYNMLRDSIEYKDLKYTNEGQDSDNRGIETSITVRPINYVSIKTNYSYLDIIQKGEEDIQKYAKNRTNLIVNLTPWKIIFSTHLRYCDRFFWPVEWIKVYPKRIISDIQKQMGDERGLDPVSLIAHNKTVEVKHFISADFRIGFRVWNDLEVGFLAKNVFMNGRREHGGCNDYDYAQGKSDDKCNENSTKEGDNIEAERIPTYYGAYVNARF